MDGSGATRSVGEVRSYLLDQLNRALRRPGMYGGELSLRLYLDALAFLDKRDQAIEEEMTALRSWGAFVSTGVTGAVEQVLGERSEDVMASVYAEVARRAGWLALDSPVPSADYRRIHDALEAWCGEDRTLWVPETRPG